MQIRYTITKSRDSKFRSKTVTLIYIYAVRSLIGDYQTEIQRQTVKFVKKMFDLQGEIIPDAVLQRSLPPSVLAWHPTKKIVAVGWESGEVLIWNEVDHELHESNRLHKNGVSVLEWSSNGSRLVSGDTVSHNEM